MTIFGAISILSNAVEFHRPTIGPNRRRFPNKIHFSLTLQYVREIYRSCSSGAQTMLQNGNFSYFYSINLTQLVRLFRLPNFLQMLQNNWCGYIRLFSKFSNSCEYFRFHQNIQFNIVSRRRFATFLNFSAVIAMRTLLGLMLHCTFVNTSLAPFLTNILSRSRYTSSEFVFVNVHLS